MALGSALATALQEPPRQEGIAPAEAEPSIPCKVAAVVMDDAQPRFERYSTLVWILALLSLGAIIAAALAYLIGDDSAPEAITGAVAGLIGGALATFIKGERDQARTDRDAAHKILNEQCEGQSKEQVLQSMGVQ